jgi:hypothetical protein
MHALNHFLINIDDTDDIIVQDGRIFATEHGAFESYVEDKFDENNWYTPLALVAKDGDTVISTDEYRGGFDAWIGDRDSWDFDKATEAAYAALYHDINRDLNMLTNSEYAYDREFESIEQAADIIRQSLAISYSGNDDGIEDWKLSARPRLARTYENLTDKYFTPPFFNAWDVNPYNARTFDLTDGEDYGLAILTVDVHT